VTWSMSDSELIRLIFLKTLATLRSVRKSPWATEYSAEDPSSSRSVKHSPFQPTCCTLFLCSVLCVKF
jgi:hypothetical protein